MEGERRGREDDDSGDAGEKGTEESSTEEMEVGIKKK